jgi:hypothetical protein
MFYTITYNKYQGTREGGACPSYRHLLQRAPSKTHPKNILLVSWGVYTRAI